MQGVILAAGKGSRLNPITTKRSKAMLPILGKPIVARVMETLIEGGVNDFIFVVSDLDSEIVKYFKYHTSSNVRIQFVTQSKRLGMAHALNCATALIRGTFVLSACDNLVTAEHVGELISSYRATGATATLSLLKVGEEMIPKTGIVEFEGDYIKNIIEKPSVESAPSNVASIALYVLPEKLFEFLPRVKKSARGEYELQDAIQMLINTYGGVRGVITKSRLTLTSAKDLLEINRQYLINGGDKQQLTPYKVGAGTQLTLPLRIEEGTRIGENCRIGPHVYIEKNCQIEDNVVIREAVVLRDCRVTAGRRVENEVLS